MSPEEDKSLRLDQSRRAESWTMWVIVSSWRLRGYCRRKWPSWNQVALSIPLRSPARLASPRSLSFSFSILFSLSSPLLPSALLAPLNPSFHLAFPSFVHHSVFSFPPFLDYSSLLWSSLWTARGRGHTKRRRSLLFLDSVPLCVPCRIFFILSTISVRILIS